jgi:hypothetical protein
MARPKNQKARRLFGLRLEEQLITELRHAALDEGRPANQLHEEAIRDWLKKFSEKRKKVDKAPGK